MKEQTDVQCSHTRGASPDKRTRIPCVWVAKCNRSSCGFRHPPVCVNYKSEIGCSYGKRCQYRHVDAEEKPSKRSKKESTQGAVAILDSKEVYSMESWIIGIERFGRTHRNIFSRHLVPNANSGTKRVISRNYPKMCLMSEILARPDMRIQHL